MKCSATIATANWFAQRRRKPGDLRIFLTFVMGMGAVYGQACDL